MRAAGGLKADLGTRPPRHSRGPLPPTWPPPARTGRRAASAAVLCGTRATREADEQQLQVPRRAHVMVVSVRR